MVHLKKIIHSFVLIMFFTHHAIIMPMQSNFSPAPIFSQIDSQSFSAVGSSTFKNMFSEISNNVTNNPHMYVVIAAGCIVAIVCTSVYKSGIFSKDLNLDSSAITTPIQKEIQSSLDALPWAIKGPIKVIIVPLKTLMQLLRSGVVNYIAYNKKHLGLSTVSMIGGYVTGHPVIGGAIGGMVFLHGAFNNRFDITDGKIEEVKKTMAANHAETKEEFKVGREQAVEHTQGIMKKISEETNKLSDELSGVDVRITAVGNQVNEKIEGVAQQVVTVHSDVQKISGQINALKAQLEQENSKGVQRDQKADEALAKLQVLSTKADNSCVQIETVALQLTKQQKELAAQLEGQMNGLSEQLEQQKNEQITQGSILSDIQQKVEKMLKLESDYASLVELFKDGQARNGEIEKKLQEDHTIIKKAATEFSVFYIEFTGVKTQVDQLRKSFIVKEEKDNRVFESMSRKQVEVDNAFFSLQAAVERLALQNQQQAMQSQQQYENLLNLFSSLKPQQEERPSLKNSVEPTSVPFISTQQFPQSRFNNFRPTASKFSHSSNTQPLQIADANSKDE